MTDLRGFWKQQTEVQKNRLVERRKNRRAKKRKRKADRLLLKAGVAPQGKAHKDYRRDDKFYRSEAWRRIRYLALRNSDSRCECCGASAANGIVLHVDHIKPRHSFPWLSLELTNLQ